MLTAPPQVSFSEYALDVRDMVDYGLSLVDVEGAVANTDLPEDSKAALWLLAWSDPRRGGRGGPEVPPLVSAPFVPGAGRVLQLRRG